MKRDDERSRIELGIAYLHGYTEAKIEGFAASAGIPAELLTQGLAALLHAGWPGGEDSVPALRREAAKVLPAVREVEVAKHAYGQAAQDRVAAGKTRKVQKGRKSWQSKSVKATRGMTAYWAQMTPEERKAEVKRRRAVAIKRRKEVA